MTIGKSRPTIGLVGLLALTAACEPASLVDARNQIARGGERTIVYALPLIDTVFKIQTLLDSSTIDTTAAGLLAVVVDPESLSVGFGDELVFAGINLDTVAVSLPSEDLARPGTTIPFSVSYDGLGKDTILDDIDTVLVQSGVLSVTTRNKLPIPVTYTATLDGFVQQGGAPLVGSGTVPAAAGDGSYEEDVLTFDLYGVTVVPAAVTVDLVGSATVEGAPIPAGLGVNAIVQFGGISTLQVESVAGSLDPTVTPELNVSIEEVEEISRGDLDFGDLEDPVEQSTLNDATIALAIGNSADVQVELSDFYLGVVKLDGFGNVPRDAFGDPVYEEDGAGNPILVVITDPGETTLTLAAFGTTNLDLTAAPLVDRLVHLLLDDERAAVVAVSDVAVGNGTQARVTATDSVSVAMGITIGMDFTIPAGGVLFTRNTTGDGLEFDDEDADQIVERLDSATVITEAVNGTPFGVELDIAFVGDSVGDDVDVFSLPGAVLLNTIFLSEPTVDAQGNVTTPSSSTMLIPLTGAEARQLMGPKYSASVRTRLLPGTGGGGRGALRATDEISLQSQARVVLRSGGVQ